MVFFGIPNLSDAALLVIPFSIYRMILHFCISDTLLSARAKRNDDDDYDDYDDYIPGIKCTKLA